MQDFTVLAGLVMAALGAVALTVKLWSRTRGMGGAGKLLARGALSLLVVVPVLVMLVFGTAVFQASREASEPPARSAMPPPAPKKAEKPAEPEVLPRYAEPSEDDAKPGAGSFDDGLGDQGAAGGAAGEGAPEPTGAEPPPPPPPPATEEEGASRGLGGEDEAATPPPEPEAPAAPAPAEEAKDAWEIVPVFYGTDRSRADEPKRINYGNGRGRRLELGRALVTVPKSHTVPQIERPWSFRIPFTGIEIGESEDPKEHFTMKEVTALSEKDFLALVGQRLAASQRYEKNALIFVHGFNTTFDFAVYRTAQISYDLKFDGAAFTYSWPSGAGVLDYTYDRESSGQSEPFLKDFVKLVLEKTGAKAVSIVAHSMGNQPILQVLKDLRAAKPEGVIFNQIILAAPDVDRDNFENIAREIKGLAKGVTLYASKNDKALAISRNVNGGVPRAGDVPATGPLVIQGVETVDVTAVSTDSLGLNHSGYAENNDLLQDVRVLIEKGVHPPEKRFATTKMLTTPNGPYWQLLPLPKPPQ